MLPHHQMVLWPQLKCSTNGLSHSDRPVLIQLMAMCNANTSLKQNEQLQFSFIRRAYVLSLVFVIIPKLWHASPSTAFHLETHLHLTCSPCLRIDGSHSILFTHIHLLNLTFYNIMAMTAGGHTLTTSDSTTLNFIETFNILTFRFFFPQ